MKIFASTRRKAAIGAVGVVAALGVGGTAYAATATSSSSATSAGSTGTTSSPSSTAKASTHRSLWARADLATVEVKVKGHWVTYTMDRGQVTKVSPTSITVLRPDGQSATEIIGPSTRFVGVSSESAVAVGKSARVLSENGSAIRISQRAAGSPTTPPSTTSPTG